MHTTWNLCMSMFALETIWPSFVVKAISRLCCANQGSGGPSHESDTLDTPLAGRPFLSGAQLRRPGLTTHCTLRSIASANLSVVVSLQGASAISAFSPSAVDRAALALTCARDLVPALRTAATMLALIRFLPFLALVAFYSIEVTADSALLLCLPAPRASCHARPLPGCSSAAPGAQRTWAPHAKVASH
jgi:hypothetical protein